MKRIRFREQLRKRNEDAGGTFPAGEQGIRYGKISFMAQEECMLTKSIVIKRPQGLEARPIAELVQVASKYDSRVYLEHGERKVNAKSIMGMMSLHARTGECVEVTIDGHDEENAMEEITAFLCSGSRASGAFAAV